MRSGYKDWVLRYYDVTVTVTVTVTMTMMRTMMRAMMMMVTMTAPHLDAQAPMKMRQFLQLSICTCSVWSITTKVLRPCEGAAESV